MVVNTYFLTRMQYFKTGEIVTSFETCDSRTQAMSKHYTYFGEDMANDELSGSATTVLNWLGENVICDNWGQIVSEENNE